jgi:ribosomal protein L11 methylase PrmA
MDHSQGWNSLISNPMEVQFGQNYLRLMNLNITNVILAKQNRNYSAIMDIGCAEGYYAVGLGKMFQTKVYAFDTNKEALKTCETMEQINDVEILFGDFCNKDILTALELRNRALIVIHCEGYEKQLISPEVTRELRNHDFIIDMSGLY